MAPTRITAAILGDPAFLYEKLNPPGSAGAIELMDLIHVGLTHVDRFDVRGPALAEEVPSTENGLWTVLADGRMRLTWRIKPGAAWHDGTLFTSEDLLFTAAIVRDRDIPLLRLRTYDLIERVEAPDSVVLKREWATSHRGTVLINPTIVRFMLVQFRPDFVNPRALLDLRVRRALAHSADREGINQGLFGGALPLAEVPHYEELERTVVKYAHDFRRTEQLMNDAGHRKGNEGIYAGGSGEPFDFEIWAQAGSREQDAAIVADGWRRAGFKVREHVIPAAQGTDGEVRSSFPALGTSGTGHDERNLRLFSNAQISSPANRWRGVNCGGWVSAECDRVWDTLNEAAL